MLRFARNLIVMTSIMLMATSASSQQSGFTIRGKATNLPAELFASGLPNLSIQSSSSGSPLFEATLGQDGRFEFSKIPPGSYSMYLGGKGRGLSVLPIEVRNADIENLSIDLMNNPFPEMPGGARAPLFDESHTLTLEGIVTSEIASPGLPARAPARYFRMKVEGVSWAVLLYVLDGTFPTSDASKLHVGDNVRVVLNPSKDGNHRALLVQPDKNDPFSAVVIH